MIHAMRDRGREMIHAMRDRDREMMHDMIGHETQVCFIARVSCAVTRTFSILLQISRFMRSFIAPFMTVVVPLPLTPEQ